MNKKWIVEPGGVVGRIKIFFYFFSRWQKVGKNLCFGYKFGYKAEINKVDL